MQNQYQNIYQNQGVPDVTMHNPTQNSEILNNAKNLRKNSKKVDEVTPEMKQVYAQIFENYGAETANNWLKDRLVSSHLSLQNDNEAVIREIQQKYAEIYGIPAVRDAIQAYIEMDLDPSISLREQGFHQVAEYIAAIYRAGYDSAMGLKNQNDFDKSRMGSAVNSSMPHYQSNRVFTRSEIRAMSPEDFMRNEKAIFDQLNKGLIK